MIDEKQSIQWRSDAKWLLNRYSWSLVTEDELVEQMLAASKDDKTTNSENPKKLALTLYSSILYAAFTRDEDKFEQSHSEILRYLSGVIARSYQDPEVKKSILQDALARIWVQREQVKSPETFIRFCLFRLQHAKTAYEREVARRAKHESLEDDLENEKPQSLIVEEQFEQVNEDECTQLRKSILKRYDELYQKFSRAQRNLRIVFNYYFDRRTSAEIAKLYEVTVEQVHVILARGREKLCSDALLMQLLLKFRENCKGFEADAHTA